MDGKCVVVHKFPVIVPQGVQKNISGGDAPLPDEAEKDPVFRQSQGQDFSRPADLHPLGVQQQAAPGQRAEVLAQQYPDAAEQLLNAEGLGHIVVAPGVQPPDDVEFLVPGGEK